MNMSVTIPQLFYDVIARVVPGFVFLVALNLELSGTGLRVIEQPASSESSIAIIFNSFGYCVVCYVLGWVLSALTFCGLRDDVKKECRDKLHLTDEYISFSQMYQKIRLRNEAAGFRIAKLRAEARMLETSRTGMVFILLIAVGMLALNRAGWTLSPQPSSLEGVLRICVPALIAIALWKRERSAWENYHANVYSVYRILFGSVAKNSTEQDERSTQMATYAVASYNVRLGRIPWVGLGSDSDKWPVAGIRCRQQSGGAYLDIVFMPPGVALPANSSSGDYHISYRPFSEFSAYIDILRNEAPIYMTLDAARPERHDIGTAFEPVGAGD